MNDSLSESLQAWGFPAGLAGELEAILNVDPSDLQDVQVVQLRMALLVMLGKRPSTQYIQVDVDEVIKSTEGGA